MVVVLGLSSRAARADEELVDATITGVSDIGFSELESTFTQQSLGTGRDG